MPTNVAHPVFVLCAENVIVCYYLYMNHKTVVLYHGGCPDGFGGAWAAWKKFGNNATYIPQKDRLAPPPEIDGAEVYLIDFCFSTQEIMDEIQVRAARLVVLDHHESAEGMVKSMREHVYDVNRSGSGIAWDYFFPDTPRPSFVNYLEDRDLYRHRFPETGPLHAYLEAYPFSFAFWDEIAYALDHEDQKSALMEKARIYEEYFNLLAEVSVDKAKLVMFEGHRVLFATCHPVKSLASRVGNLLARKLPPMALIVTAHPNGYGVSIRGDGSIDVAKIAQRFGGGGHHSAAGFLVHKDSPLPWVLLEEDGGLSKE